MNTKDIPYYYGKDHFAPGESIYLNRAVEIIEPHTHAHDYIEIAYVVSGRGIHTIGEKDYHVTKGDLFLINYDIPHAFHSLPEHKDSPLIVSNCLFNPEFIDQSLIASRCFSDISSAFFIGSLFEEGIIENDIKILGQDNNDVGELYERMYQEYLNKSYGYIELLRAYLLELLIKIFRLLKQKDTGDLATRDNNYFDNVIQFMKENYKAEIKLDDLAAVTFLSRNYFCAKFKECTGVTVLEYLQKLRIDEACKLLRQSDKKVSDVAEAVGYRDIKFFNKLFKKISGKSPREYRACLKSDANIEDSDNHTTQNEQ